MLGYVEPQQLIQPEVWLSAQINIWIHIFDSWAELNLLPQIRVT